MEPHTSSYLSKYIVKLFRLYRRQRADYIYTTACATNKSLLWNQTLSYPWRPHKLARSRSPCTRKSWRLSVLTSRVVSTYLFPPFCTFSREVQFSVRKPIVTVSHVLLENKTNVINGFKVLFPKLATVHIFFLSMECNHCEIKLCNCWN